MKTQVIKSTIGFEFSLNDRLMIHINPTNTGFYVAERRAVKEARDGEAFEYIVFGKPHLRAADVSEFVQKFEVGHGFIKLGCQEFRGANAKALKKWAKSYRPPQS